MANSQGQIRFFSFVIGYFIFFLAGNSPLDLCAQGLAGKRVLLSYDIKMFNSLKEPIYRDQLKDIHHWLKFNTTHQFGGEYILNSRISLGGSYQFYRTNSSDNKFYIFSDGIGVYIKGFLQQNGSLAPLGNWWKVSLVQYNYQAKRITDFWQKGDHINHEVQLSFGRQVVLYKDLLINMGIEIGGSFSKGKTTLSPNIEQEYFLQEIIGRINSHNTIFLHIGVAYAIF